MSDDGESETVARRLAWWFGNGKDSAGRCFLPMMPKRGPCLLTGRKGSVGDAGSVRTGGGGE